VYVPYLGLRDAHQSASGVSLWAANLTSGRSKPQGYDDPRWLAERAAHADRLRDLFGPFLFRPVGIDPTWLARGDGTVRRLAEAIYEERDLPGGALDNSRLATLADALLDAGCDSEGIVSHCRQQGQVHVRGCWVVDLLLRKG
jgi:hypothetical protein